MKRGSELYETREVVRTCTDSAIDPIVKGENRCFGVLYCVHELVKRISEGWILIWCIGYDATLKRYVNNTRSNGIR